MSSANLFVAFSRRQTEEIILSLSGKKLCVSSGRCSDGQETGCAYVCVCVLCVWKWKWLAEELRCLQTWTGFKCLLIDRKKEVSDK